MKNDELKNRFPVTKPEIRTDDRKSSRASKFNMINIGQILFIGFLFFIILMQGAELLFFNPPDWRDNNTGAGNTGAADKASSGANPAANSADPRSFGEAGGADGNNNDHHNINDNDTGNSFDDKNKNQETLFILGESNGQLAVLSPDGQTIYEIFNVYINTLPEYDKNLLLSGIKIKTAEELHSLIEDYSS